MSLDLLEAVATAAGTVLFGAFLIYLRSRQPDPNRGPELSAQEYLDRVEADRRTLSMPFVGKDRRRAGAAEAAAWRRAA
jgi:hypothetical protein